MFKNLFFAILLGVFIPSGEVLALEGKGLTIIYTNDVIGEIEPCG